MKRFNSNTVRSSTHLVSTPDATRRYERAVYKAAIERSEGKEVVKVRDYLAPKRDGFVPTGFKRRNDKLVKLSHEKRLIIFARAEANLAFREAARRVIDGSKEALPI